MAFRYDDDLNDDDPYAPPDSNPYVPSTGPTGSQYPWWSDPDNAPPAWMLNQNQHPTVNPGPGRYWNWAGDHWEARDAPHYYGTGDNNTTVTPPPPPRPRGPNDNFNYGGGFPDGSDFRFSPYESYGPFSYDPFTPTNAMDLYDENQNPGFQRSQDRLSRQVQNSAAYRGMVRSGMTIGDLSSVLNTNEMQRFAEFDDRRFRNWQGNYGVARDSWDRGAAENERRNNYRFNTESREFQGVMDRWRAILDSTTRLATQQT